MTRRQLHQHQLLLVLFNRTTLAPHDFRYDVGFRANWVQIWHVQLLGKPAAAPKPAAPKGPKKIADYNAAANDQHRDKILEGRGRKGTNKAEQITTLGQLADVDAEIAVVEPSTPRSRFPPIPTDENVAQRIDFVSNFLIDHTIVNAPGGEKSKAPGHRIPDWYSITPNVIGKPDLFIQTASGIGAQSAGRPPETRARASASAAGSASRSSCTTTRRRRATCRSPTRSAARR